MYQRLMPESFRNFEDKAYSKGMTTWVELEYLDTWRFSAAHGNAMLCIFQHKGKGELVSVCLHLVFFVPNYPLTFFFLSPRS